MISIYCATQNEAFAVICEIEKREGIKHRSVYKAPITIQIFKESLFFWERNLAAGLTAAEYLGSPRKDEIYTESVIQDLEEMLKPAVNTESADALFKSLSSIPGIPSQ